MVTTQGSLTNQILNLIKSPFNNISTHEFNTLANSIFKFQYTHNKAYQRYCNKIKKITKKNKIPFAPADIFKYAYCSCFPLKNAVQVFATSGTSFGIAGRHYFSRQSLNLKNQIFCSLSKELLIPEIDKIRVAVLCVPSNLRNSKFLHNANLLIEKHGTTDSDYFIDKYGNFEKGKLMNFLKKFSNDKIPIFFIINSDLILDFIEVCNKNNLIFPLPKKSRIMLSGFKEHNVSKKEFFHKLQLLFDLPDYYIIDDYGMTESISSWYDNVLRNNLIKLKQERFKEDPSWCKTTIVDPLSLKEVNKGKIGLIRFINLANIYSCSFIQTNDLGYKIGNGFEVIGKASHKEAPGYYNLLDLK